MNRELYSIVSPCSNMFNNNCNDDDVDEKSKKINHKKKISIIIGLFITFFAMYLAYDCNKDCESPAMVIFYMIIAGLFSGLYLLYYLVVRVFIGKKCNKKLKFNYSVTSPEYNLFTRK